MIEAANRPRLITRPKLESSIYEFGGADNSRLEATNYLLNSTANKTSAKWLTFVTGILVGMNFGYFRSLTFSLQESGATFEDQSLFMLAQLPLSFRVLVGPMTDSLYIKILGRNKTTVIFSSLLIFCVQVYLALRFDWLIEVQDFRKIALLMFCLNCAFIFFYSGADSLMISSFPMEFRPNISRISDLGVICGEFLAYNIFLPLNTPKFLNRMLSTESKFDQPIVTHKMLLLTQALLLLLLLIYIVVFFSEISYADAPGENQPGSKNSLMQVFSYMAEFFYCANLRTLVFYVLLTRMFRQTASGLLKLKFVQNDFTKADLATADTIGFPVLVFINTFVLKKELSSKPFRLFHWMIYVNVLASGLMLFGLVDYRNYHLRTRAYLFLSLSSILDKITARPVFFNTFLYKITPSDNPSTFVGFFNSLSNASSSLPTSLGYFLEDKVPVSCEVFILSCLACQFLVHLAFHNYSSTLDDLPKERFGHLNPDNQRLLNKPSEEKETDKDHLTTRQVTAKAG